MELYVILIAWSMRLLTLLSSSSECGMTLFLSVTADLPADNEAILDVLYFYDIRIDLDAQLDGVIMQKIPKCCSREMKLVMENIKFLEARCELCNDVVYVKKDGVIKPQMLDD